MSHIPSPPYTLADRCSYRRSWAEPGEAHTRGRLDTVGEAETERGMSPPAGHGHSAAGPGGCHIVISC